jgi:flagella synthesis protein FlgN
MHSFGPTPAGSLHEELKVTRQLLQILRREQEQLVEANIDGLIALIEEKAKIVARMSELANWRHQTLANAGFTATEEGMQEWLKSPAGTATANKSWSELLTLIASGKELNRTNGILIGKHMARNQTALNILQGGTPGGAFYGPDGQATTRTGTRSLVVS